MRFFMIVAVLLAGSATHVAQAAIVSLTFDDVFASVATNAMPIMKRAGFRGTIYLSTTLVDTSKYLSWHDVKMFDASGWEIGAHTHTHTSLCRLSDESIEFEFNTSMRLFAERGFHPTSFAAPCGEYDERVMRAIKRHYASQRDAWGNGGINLLPIRDPYRIASLPITSATTTADIDCALDDVVRRDGWLVLQFHAVDDTIPSGSWATTKSLLQYTVNEMARRKIYVLTVSEVLSKNNK